MFSALIKVVRWTGNKKTRILCGFAYSFLISLVSAAPISIAAWAMCGFLGLSNDEKPDLKIALTAGLAIIASIALRAALMWLRARAEETVAAERSNEVRVRMNWQTDGMQTGWVRVMTPDGGSSSDVKSNRGFVFIPEVGDQVLLGFRHGDPAKPYILGSLFNGVTGSGGFAANHKKSLTTRSGSTVAFDDTAHTILLQTTRANKIFIDELNGTITISSAEEVNVNTKNVNINASENMNVNVGKNFTMQVGEQSSINIGKDSSLSINGSSVLSIMEDAKSSISGDQTTNIYGNMNLSVMKSIKTKISEDSTYESYGVTTITSQDNLYLKSSTNVDIAKE